MERLPLEGLRVVDTTDLRGELCGRLLADLGADVVRVEPPGGARSRRVEPLHEGQSLHFAVRNLNKSGIVLDLTSADDRARFVDLLDRADIWVESSRPDELAALGLDPRQVAEAHPHLVVTSVTDFGWTGPYRDFRATNDVMVGLSWMLYKAGTTDLPPVLPPGQIAYDIAGVTAAFASLAAHLQARRTGRGQWIDLSVMEAVAQTTDWGLSGQPVDTVLDQPTDIRSGAGPIYPIIPCVDGWVRPSVVTLAEWRKMRAWLGEPPDLQDESFDTTMGRVAAFEEVLRPHYERHFRERTMIEASEEGQDLRIPITPLLRPDNVRTAPQYVALGSFVDAELLPGLTAPVVSGYYTVDGERLGPRRPAPALGGTTVDWSERSTAGPTGEPTDRPFTGLRVLDFGVAGAAPEIARLLGEYGADVVRVESPGRPDLFRQLGGPTLMGTVFASSNRTKRSIGVDFEDPEAVRLVLDLVARADVVVENLPPGTMARWGLGADVMEDANPRVLVISSQTMGTHGPWRNWRGYGANTQPVGGMTYLWSYPELDQPIGTNTAFPDHVVGRLGAVFAAATAVGRDRGTWGDGAHVEVVQAEVCLSVLADLFTADALDPGSVGPVGNRRAAGAPWGVYPCEGVERWCVITCEDDDQWHGLVAAMGRPAWALDPELETEEGRRARHDELDERIAEWTAGATDVEVMTTLQAHGVPAGRMMYLSDHPGDPHLRDRGYVCRIDQPGHGPMFLDGPSFRGTAIGGPTTTPAPLLGEHTRQVASEWLGLGDDEIERLLAAGVLNETTHQPVEED